MKVLRVLKLGVSPYEEALNFQRDIQRQLIDGACEDTLILCSHPAVITMGRGANAKNICVSGAYLEERNIPVVSVERGGDVTYHGPGQLVAYPLFDLNRHRRDVGWFMRSLEQCVILMLQSFGIAGKRVPGKTGVWTQAEDKLESKICSMGIRISRWCTLHGLAVNVMPVDDGFSLITPCGITGVTMTSIEELIGLNGQASNKEKSALGILIDQASKRLISAFQDVFEFERLDEVEAKECFSRTLQT